MTTKSKFKDVDKLAQLLRDVVALAGEPGVAPAQALDDDDVARLVRSALARESDDVVRGLVRSALAEYAVDTFPYSYSVETAIAATGLSKTRIHNLIRDEVLAVRKEGSKLFIVGTSLRRYIDSLPPRGLK